MTFQPGANLYTQGFGSRPENVEVPHIDVRAPAATDVLYPLGKRWINKLTGAIYTLASLSVSNGITTASWTLEGSGGSGAINSITGDTGGAELPSAGNFNLLGTANQIAVTGSAATETFSLVGPYTPATYTAHGVLVGEGTSSIVAVAPSATSGVALVSQGAAADPAYGTVVVAGGGTGLTTITVHDLVVGNGTSPMTIITNGTTGQALVAATGADPAWGTLPVAGGGTGATTLTGIVTGNGTSAMTANAVTEHGVLIGGAANAASSLAVAATGTVLAGSTGADPAFTGSPSVSGSVTAGTSITATAGDITATLGNVIVNGAAKQFQCHGGAVTDFIGQATLTNGTVTVANTNIAATDRVFVNRSAKNTSTAYGVPQITITAATNFVLTSCKSDTTTETNDQSTFDYVIVRQV